jgi:hypothetical protein
MKYPAHKQENFTNYLIVNERCSVYNRINIKNTNKHSLN